MAEPKVTKPCPMPNCKGTLVLRVNRTTGHKFLACDHWQGKDGCKHTEPLPQDLVMRALGAPTLF